jgi:nicotinate-nucleotide--dimethylbenzimidazole phosphoribosyltransferase
MRLKDELLQKINSKTKPPGSLGKLEDIALQLGLIQATTTPQIKQPTIVVFAADHGIATTGKVNPYPQSVTAQMVLNFVDGGAAINVFCKQHGITLHVVDAGVNTDFDPSLPIRHEKIRKGSSDYSLEEAMSAEEAKKALQKGKEILQEVFNNGCNTIGLGEMGIGNTSSAALLLHHYTGLPIEECTGRGTGASNELLQQKIQLLKQTALKHRLTDISLTTTDVLRRVGGFEIAMMAGAYQQAANLKMTIVVDGFIATAALLVALKADPSILTNCLFAHCSDETGHKKMLDHLNVQPLLSLGMRLGEGTGAALAIPLVQSAALFLNEMASFESAAVSEKIN